MAPRSSSSVTSGYSLTVSPVAGSVTAWLLMGLPPVLRDDSSCHRRFLPQRSARGWDVVVALEQVTRVIEGLHVAQARPRTRFEEAARVGRLHDEVRIVARAVGTNGSLHRLEVRPRRCRRRLVF